MNVRGALGGCGVAVALAAAGCHQGGAPAPHASGSSPSATGVAPPATSAPRAAASSSAAGATALGVQVEELAAGMPRAAPSKLDVTADKGGLVLELREGLACDGHWVWRAVRTGPGRVTLRLSDENHSSMRSSCARRVHERVTVSGLEPGSYQVHVAMPTGYGSLDRRVTLH